jgi:ADP-heptose:LPS heptosyltransferase
MTAVPALRGLRRLYSGERLVLAAPPGLRDLVELIDAVDELLPTPGLGTLEWPGEPPAVAVNLHGRGPQSIHDLLGQGPAKVISHRHPDFPELPGAEWESDVHDVDRWCHLVEFAGGTADRGDLRLPVPPGPSPAANAVVIHPGAAFPARMWPPGRYVRVAAALHADGYPVVVTGSADEHASAADVAEAAGLPDTAVLAGRTGLAELATLVAGAALVVCGDTGIGHLATAFGTPSVLLFGPTPPRLWGPPPGAVQHVALWAGEVGDPRGDRPDPGLLLLGEDRVLAAARMLVGGRAAHG